MKRAISFALCALLIVASFSFIVSAKGLSDWTTTSGFKLKDSTEVVPVAAKETADGIQVALGGYYTNGEDAGAIISNQKYQLDGLSVEVRFDKVSPTGDRWISIGLMEKPALFKTGDIASNRGYTNLIRPKAWEADALANSSIRWQHVEAIEKFGVTAEDAVTSAFEDGLTLKLEVNKVDDKYVFTLNGVKSTYDFSKLNDVFTDGEAHIVIAASGADAKAGDYNFTITKINGQPVVEAASSGDNGSTTAPQAGDAGLIAAACAVVLSAGAALVLKKRKTF